MMKPEVHPTSVNSDNYMVLPEQKIAKMIGLNGCYFTCLLWLAESFTKLDYDIINEFNYCCNQTAPDNYKWLTEECYVYHPELILEHYTKKNVSVKKIKGTVYNARKNEYIIGCYLYNGSSHFVVLDNDLNVIFDPLGKSNTVQNGTLESLRVFTIVE